MRLATLRTALVFCLSLLLTPWCQSAEPQAALATTLAVRPNVTVFKSSTDKKGSPLREGSSLRAGARMLSDADASASLLMIDGSVVRIAPNSDFSVGEPGSKGGPGQVLHLLKGALFASVKKQFGSRFRIVTSNAISAVKGTRLSVETSDGQTELKVLSGVVELGLDGKGAPIDVKAGYALSAVKERLGKPRRLDAAEMKALREAFKDKVFSAKAAYSKRVKELKSQTTPGE